MSSYTYQEGNNNSPSNPEKKRILTLPLTISTILPPGFMLNIGVSMKRMGHSLKTVYLNLLNLALISAFISGAGFAPANEVSAQDRPHKVDGTVIVPAGTRVLPAGTVLI